MQLDATIEPEAGIRAGLREIPVRYAAFSRDTLTSDEFIRELAKHNETQRVKTNAEHLREILVGMSREDAYQELVEYREGESYVPAEGIELGEKKRRARISSAKGPFLAAIKRVIQERRNFWPLSDRAVHYGLVSLNEGFALSQRQGELSRINGITDSRQVDRPDSHDLYLRRNAAYFHLGLSSGTARFPGPRSG